jgi:hypothetical protein
MLQEENESVLEKVKQQMILYNNASIGFMQGFNKKFLILIQLRLAEERCEEAEARAKELEKQVR